MKEFKNNETDSQLEHFKNAGQYRQEILKNYYTKKSVKIMPGKFGIFFILTQVFALSISLMLFIISYVPKWKFLVYKILP